MPSPPAPPPPPFPQKDISGGDHGHSSNPSILIIAAIIAVAIVASASIHLLLRVLSRSRSPPSVHHLASSSSSSSSSPSISSRSQPPSDRDPKAVIDSLPLFSLSSWTAKPSSSLDCAVCLYQFEISDELRLLPSCRHAFHSQCIDTWLKSNLSCPLCRSPILPLSSPPRPPPPPEAVPARSDSFRVEIGSVSRRTDESSTSAAAPSHVRSYSLGSSFEYVVDEDIEAVLARVRPEKPDLEAPLPPPLPPPPCAVVAEVAGGSHRSWLKDYMDRLTSSASSSFSSLRFSQRGSHRLESAAAASAGGVAGEGWDLERNLHLHLEEEDGGFLAFYRWLLGT